MSNHNVVLKVTKLDGSQHVYQVRNCSVVLKLLAELHSDLFKTHTMSRGTVSLLKRGKYRIKTTNKGVLKHYKVESVPVEWLPLRKPWEWLKISG